MLQHAGPADRMSIAETVRSLHLFLTFLWCQPVWLRTFWVIVLWAAHTVWVFDGMCEEFPECVFLVWYVNVCVCDSMCFFTGVRCTPGVFLKGARQLPFTATGGNKQWGRDSYLPLLLGKKAEEGGVYWGHSITQHSCRARRDSLERRVLASLNSYLRTPSFLCF